jgi:hypothetical protein
MAPVSDHPLEQVSCDDVARAIRRRLLSLPDGDDPLGAVMGVVGPVLDAKDAALARLRPERDPA